MAREHALLTLGECTQVLREDPRGPRVTLPWRTIQFSFFFFSSKSGQLSVLMVAATFQSEERLVVLHSRYGSTPDDLTSIMCYAPSPRYYLIGTHPPIPGLKEAPLP
jgi:hypothetical protein